MASAKSSNDGFVSEPGKYAPFNVFLEANPPLIEQFFEEETATIKLRLTDEAYKA